MNYWLMKSEPSAYSITDLKRDSEALRRSADRQIVWDGVRNYQARNFLRQMQPGDLAFFYHSNTTPLGIVGLMRVVTSMVVDPTQFDPDSPYYDAKSTPQSPTWHTVSVEFVEAFDRLLSLEILKQFNGDVWVTRKGNRLSVMPVDEAVAKKILAMTKS